MSFYGIDLWHECFVHPRALKELSITYHKAIILLHGISKKSLAKWNWFLSCDVYAYQFLVSYNYWFSGGGIKHYFRILKDISIKKLKNHFKTIFNFSLALLARKNEYFICYVRAHNLLDSWYFDFWTIYFSVISFIRTNMNPWKYISNFIALSERREKLSSFMGGINYLLCAILRN